VGTLTQNHCLVQHLPASPPVATDTAMPGTIMLHVGLSAVGLKCTDVSAVADSSRLEFFSIVFGHKAPTFQMIVVPSCTEVRQSQGSHWTFSEAAVARVKTDG